MGQRKSVPETTVDEVLLQCRRRCCLCFGLRGDYELKQGQIAHLDQNPSNGNPANLAYLCFEHHNEYDSKARQSKGITLGEVKSYRNRLVEHNQLLAAKSQKMTEGGSYSREEFDEAIFYYTGTHRSRSAVLAVNDGKMTLDEISGCIPPCDPEWTKAILEHVIDHGWVRHKPGNYDQYEITLNGRRMLQVLSEIPEPAKESAWHSIWMPKS